MEEMINSDYLSLAKAVEDEESIRKLISLNTEFYEEKFQLKTIKNSLLKISLTESLLQNPCVEQKDMERMYLSFDDMYERSSCSRKENIKKEIVKIYIKAREREFKTLMIQIEASFPSIMNCKKVVENLY